MTENTDDRDTCSIEEISKYCMATDCGLECVCSRRAAMRYGTGNTAKKEESVVYYYARQIDDLILALQSLNASWVPSGPKIMVSMEELILEYQPEVDMFVRHVRPAMKQVAKAVARGDRHRENGQPYSAEMEYNNALALDEHNVRALFGLGLTYLQYDQAEKAARVFEQLIGIDGFADPQYKHLFNQFGIELRKQSMCEEACRYYGRAIELCGDDENLYFNLARACVDGGRLQEAENALTTCVRLNPGHDEGRKFLTYLSAVSLE